MHVGHFIETKGNLLQAIKMPLPVGVLW